MNNFLKKAAAAAIAAVIAASGMGLSAFAAEAKTVREETATVAYQAAVAKPVFSVKGSKGVRQISLTTTTKGATIYYTTNGSTPTTKSSKLKAGSYLQIKKKVTIKAIAVVGSSKSAVMTKTFNVTTLPGDVTGDGNINSSDYTRLKNYLNGKTKYICTDNADVDGSGKIASKDLTLISQYLNGQIKKFPVSGSTTTTTKVTAPKVTVYKAYGGKNIELTCTDSGAKIYYTTNGKTPTKDSTLYKSKFLVKKNTTVKYVAYKNGSYSEVKTKDVQVDQCKDVSADQPTNKTYTDKVVVKLTTPTSSSTTTKIYYTVDGTNPMSSTTSYVYGSGITLTKDTVLKAYATAKGYTDSVVSTFYYKVDETNNSFSISGTVWDDTPKEDSTPDGQFKSGESGINGINVYLQNIDTNTYEASTKTTTLNGVAGSYRFDNAKAGSRYKVVFEYNGQAYRAYDYTVSGGNQATATASVTPITVKYAGAYNSSNTLIASGANSYAKASSATFFNMRASTSSYYNSNATNVNLALVSNFYGKLKLTLTPKQVGNVAYSTSTTVSGGDLILYELELKNESPSTALSAAEVKIYVPNKFNSIYFTGVTANTSTATSSGYTVYEIPNMLGSSSLAKGNSIKVQFQAVVASNVTSGEKLPIYAEVTGYRFANASFDKASIPGNLVVGTVRENDEAVATVSVLGTTKNISSSDSRTFDAYIGGRKTVNVTITNSTKSIKSDEIVVSKNSSYVDYAIGTPTTSGSTVTIPIDLVVSSGATESTTATVYVKLADDQNKYVQFTLNIKKPPVSVSLSSAEPTVEAGSSNVAQVTITVTNASTISAPLRVEAGAGLTCTASQITTNGNNTVCTYNVSAEGVSPSAAGVAAIWFTSVDDSSKSVTVKVTVTAPVTTPTDPTSTPDPNTGA